MPLTGRARKRNRSTPATEGKRSRQLTENELESRTAWAVGLNPSALTDEEATLLPPGSNESAYIKVRQSVFAKNTPQQQAWIIEQLLFFLFHGSGGLGCCCEERFLVSARSNVF